MLFTNTRGGFDYAKDPAVVAFGGRYYLYFTAAVTPEEKAAGLSITVGIAVSDDMENWEFIGTLPITQECEKNGIGAPGCEVIGGRIHMFYQTYGNGRLDAICHAVSDDGVGFVKDETNPVFRPTADWCCGRAIDADTAVLGDRLYLYFATRDHAFEVQKLGAAYAPVNSTFSANDFRQLTASSVLFPELVWEKKCIEAPAAVVHDGKIYMFYGGAYNCEPQQIGCAVSSDGRTFEKLFTDRPFIPKGKEGDFNSSESGHPYAFADRDGRVWLFYQGSPDMGKTWYISRLEIGFRNGIPYVTG